VDGTSSFSVETWKARADVPNVRVFFFLSNLFFFLSLLKPFLHVLFAGEGKIVFGSEDAAIPRIIHTSEQIVEVLVASATARLISHTHKELKKRFKRRIFL
jgi:hypothetical protein